MTDLHDLDAWYPATVAYFRALGFFAADGDADTGTLAARVRARVVANWDMPMLPRGEDDPQFADMLLLSTDPSRVWMQDIECVYPGERAYADALRAWSAISRGAFRPEAVEETWHDAPERAEVTFVVRGARHLFVHDVRTRGDMMDMAIVAAINRATGAEARLVICDNFGMPNFVTALTAAEQTRLARERGWRFWSA